MPLLIGRKLRINDAELRRITKFAAETFVLAPGYVRPAFERGVDVEYVVRAVIAEYEARVR